MKKRTKIIIITVVSLIVVATIAIGGYFLYQYHIKQTNYEQAIKLYQQENFEEALSLFNAQIDFKDSHQFAKKCKENIEIVNDYNEAKSLFENGDYSKAIKAFEELGDYKDCKEYVEKCKKEIVAEKQRKSDYEKAVALMKKCEFNAAEKLFVALGNYKDCKAQLEKLTAEKSKWGKLTLMDGGAYDISGTTREQFEQTKFMEGGFAGILFQFNTIKYATGYEFYYEYIDHTKSDIITVKGISPKFVSQGQQGPDKYYFRAFKDCADGSHLYGEWTVLTWKELPKHDEMIFLDDWESKKSGYFEMN